MKHRITFVALALLALSALPRPALAAFHLMEVEQVIGGVGGDPTAQAVQLKMRTTGQNLLNGSVRLVAHDATGAGNVTLITFSGTNPTSGACKEVLVTTAAMNAKTTPAVTGAYTMTAMPASYLAAGSLTFETTGGTIYQRVSWGGASYTGPNTLVAGNLTPAGSGNDDDGSSAPPFGGVLVSAAAQALHFNPACPAQNVNNLADYSNTAGAAVLVNNAGAAFTVVAAVPTPGLPGASKFLLPLALGLMVVAFGFLRRRSVA